MKEIIKLGLILFVITAIAASLLAVTYEVTLDKILEQRQLADNQARKEVLVDADSFEAVSETLLATIQEKNRNVIDVHYGLSGDMVIGYVLKVRPSGFGGPMDIAVGLELDGTITGMRVVNHAETPGLGDGALKPAFYTQYEGLTVLDALNVVKVPATGNEIEAMSGATITTKAITDGVNFVVDIYDLLIVE